MKRADKKVVDYYLFPNSPWTYLGHARFGEIARRHGARVNVRPMDFRVIFAKSGGFPKPSPQRHAYWLTELERWKEHRGVPLVIEPKHFPVDPTAAALLICAAPEEKRMALAGDLMAALWRDDRDLADPQVLAALGARHRVSGGDQATFERYTEEALARGVFGSPSYVLGEEIFWGQDRLDFLERALAK